jgi:hypothetical protein
LLGLSRSFGGHLSWDLWSNQEFLVILSLKKEYVKDPRHGKWMSKYSARVGRWIMNRIIYLKIRIESVKIALNITKNNYVLYNLHILLIYTHSLSLLLFPSKYHQVWFHQPFFSQGHLRTNHVLVKYLSIIFPIVNLPLILILKDIHFNFSNLTLSFLLSDLLWCLSSCDEFFSLLRILGCFCRVLALWRLRILLPCREFCNSLISSGVRRYAHLLKYWLLMLEVINH